MFSTCGELDLPTAVSNFGGERCSRPGSNMTWPPGRQFPQTLETWTGKQQICLYTLCGACYCTVPQHLTPLGTPCRFIDCPCPAHALPGPLCLKLGVHNGSVHTSQIWQHRLPQCSHSVRTRCHQWLVHMLMYKLYLRLMHSTAAGRKRHVGQA